MQIYKYKNQNRYHLKIAKWIKNINHNIRYYKAILKN
jgi:hypothetical protein